MINVIDMIYKIYEAKEFENIFFQNLDTLGGEINAGNVSSHI